METAVIGGKEYTKEQIIEIGKEHFEAAISLRRKGVFLAALMLGFLAVSLYFFLMVINDALDLPDYKATLGVYTTSLICLIASGILFLVGVLIIVLSYTKSDDMEYVKAGVIYLNKQANKQ